MSRYRGFKRLKAEHPERFAEVMEKSHARQGQGRPIDHARGALSRQRQREHGQVVTAAPLTPEARHRLAVLTGLWEYRHHSRDVIEWLRRRDEY